jgi:hypothetical protein
MSRDGIGAGESVRTIAPLVLLLSLAPALAAAEARAQADPAEQGGPRSGCANGLPDAAPSVFNAFLDNDLFAGQDRNYTNGIGLSWVSPNLYSLTEDACLWPWARDFNQALIGLHARVPGEQTPDALNMVVVVAQKIYTPADPARSDLIEDDRPYAGWLYLGLGYNARYDDLLVSTQLNLGVIGPASFAKEAQDFVHRARGIPLFQGWDHQLSNEFGLQLVYERKYRERGSLAADPEWEWDLIGHWGGSLGNVATYANAGVEFRFGFRLPDDFGTSGLRPAGDNNSPLPRGAVHGERWGAHAFVSLDGRLVARDIFLDGNTLGDSHSVDRRWLVGDAAIGLSFFLGRYRLSFARYLRTREFDGQDRLPSYGAVALSAVYGGD